MAADPLTKLCAQVGLLDRKAPKSLEHCLRLFYYKVSRGEEEVERAKVSRGVQDEEERMQELSLDQLRDLNSKLMLITAGSEGKKEVERFSRTLALLELVARHFLDLIHAGCHLFAQWTLKVRVFFMYSIRGPVLWIRIRGRIPSQYFRSLGILIQFPVVLRIRDVYPGTDFFPSQTPDPNFTIPSASKNLSILTQKMFLSSRKYDPGCS